MPVTIDKPSSYFDTKLYTGTGSTQSITGVGFQPDWVWIKNRTTAGDSHNLFDAVRGATKRIFSDLTNAENTNANSLSAFNSDGFTVNTDSESNRNSSNFVSWNWKANGAGVSNTSGSITSTVSANTTSGFSIVTYTGNATAGSTVGHGLGKSPAFIFGKNRTGGTDGWSVYHQSLGNTKAIYLNETGGSTTTSAEWNNTTPSSTVVTLGNGNYVNRSSGSIILYCFAEIKGYSKAFSYTGNGSSDGTFVYCGFRPAFVMTKASSTTGNWKISWNTFTNGNDYNLAPNLSGAEGNANQIDLLSNGFKCRATDTDRNGSGTTYIGFAFAENPFVSSKGIPTTAR